MSRLTTFVRAHRAQLGFLVRLGLVYGVWYLLYEGWLHPDGRLDAWIAETLSRLAGTLLSLVGFEPIIQERVLGLPGAPGVIVEDACNGIETLGLFVGFVVAFPGRMARRFLFIPAGLLLVYLANAVRVAVLAALQVHWPYGFEALHGAGNMFFYAAIFVLWVVWVQVGGWEDGRRSGPGSAAAQAETRALA